MRYARIAAVLGVFLPLLLVAPLLLSARSHSNHSAFEATSDGATGLLAAAKEAGIVSRRILSTPLVLQQDPSVVSSASALVIHVPPTGHDPAERDYLAAFVLQGGTLVLADNFGAANSVLEQFGLRFERVRIAETGEGVQTARLGAHSFKLSNGQPTAIHVPISVPAVRVAETGSDSFLDRDGNGVVDSSDPRGPFATIVRVEPFDGGGAVWAVGDPTLFVGRANESEATRAFRSEFVVNLLPMGGTLYFDESRNKAEDPVALATAVVMRAISDSTIRLVVSFGAATLLGALVFPHLVEAWSAHQARPDRLTRRRQLLAPEYKPARIGAYTPQSIPTGGRWTRRGGATIILALATPLLALSYANTALGTFGSLAAVAVSAALLPTLGRIHGERTIGQARPQEDVPFDVRLKVEVAGGGAVRLEVRDATPPEFDVQSGSNWFLCVLRRRRPLETAYSLRGLVRGPYLLGPLLVRTQDPLRLRTFTAIATLAQPLDVAPKSESVRRIPFTTRLPAPTLGPHLVNRAGDGSEFHSLRGYQKGDPLRIVNWKASARSKDLVVNQRVHETMTRLTILLDARAVAGAGPANETPLVQGCRIVASVADGALRVRDRLRVATYGDGVAELPQASGDRLRFELERFLSGILPQGRTELADAVAHLAPSLKPNTPVLLVSTFDDDPSYKPAVTALRARGLLPIVIVPKVHGEPGDTAEATEPAGRREAAIRELRGMNVPVFDAGSGMPLDFLFRLGGAG